MIRFKLATYEMFNIDKNTGIITDLNGNVQETVLRKNRLFFKGMPVHAIQAHTYLGYKAGLVVHHIDENPLNNALENLVYMTAEEHIGYHASHRPSETIEKLVEANRGENNPMFGKHLSDETKQKLSVALKGKPGWNKGKKCKPTTLGKHWHISQEKLEARAEKQNWSFLGKHHTDEAKEKNRQAHLGENNAVFGTSWYNNGVVNKRLKECQDGWVKGRLKRS